MNVLENIIDEIIEHDRENPKHGTGCACHDKHARTIRCLVAEKRMSAKNFSNLMTVIGYVRHNPPDCVQ